MEKASIQCTTVYNAMDQEARKGNTDLFRSGKVKTMIVTDLAARGIDIPFLDNVINFISLENLNFMSIGLVELHELVVLVQPIHWFPPMNYLIFKSFTFSWVDHLKLQVTSRSLKIH